MSRWCSDNRAGFAPASTGERVLLSPRARLRTLCTLLLCAVLASAVPLDAQEVRVQRFRPDLDLYPQYFDLAQGADGMVYVGHENGVLRFDGNRWTLINVSRRGPVRGLLRDSRGRIWVGGSECFGYLQRLEDGSERYVDLSDRFAADLLGAPFGDVFRIVELGDQLWFGSDQHLFQVDRDGTPRGMWVAEDAFGAMHAVDGELWLHVLGKGMQRVRRGTFEAVPGGAQFAEDRVVMMRALGRNKVLIYDLDARLRLWENGVVSPVEGLDYDDLAALSATLVLDEDKVAFGGTDGVLRVLDLRRRRFEYVGVTDNYISSIERGADGALLLIDDEGLLRLPWPAQWIEYGSAAGLVGSVMHVSSANDELLISTDAGVFSAPLADDGLPVLPFERKPWDTADTWQVHDTPFGRLVADRDGVHHVVGDQLVHVGLDDIMARELVSDTHDERLVWVGGEMGLGAIRFERGKWRALAGLRQPGLVVWSMAPARAGSVWLGTDHGVRVATLVEDDGATIMLAETSGEQVGLSYGDTPYSVISATPFGVVAATDAGLYRWNGQRFVADSMYGLQALLVNEEMPWFMEDGAGNVYAQSYRALYRFEGDDWTVTNLAELRAGPVEAFAPGFDGAVWLGGARLFHYRPNDQRSRVSNPLVIVGLSRKDPGEPEATSLSVTEAVNLRGRSARITARFGLTDLAQTEPARYRFRVAGDDSPWSAWQRAPRATVDLAVGEHLLEVQARTGSGHVYSASPLPLSLTPHRYDSDLMRIAMAAGAAALLLLVAYAYNRRKLRAMAARNRLLDDIVRRRTEQLREANRQLAQQAQHDALTGVGNRRLFDQRFAALFERAKRERLTLSLLLLDVDHFKRYNDAWGHQAGDTLLRNLAQELGSLVRADCTVARYGGEEFAIIAPGSDRHSAAVLAERLVDSLPTALSGETVSIGVATYTVGLDSSVDDMVARADEALYRAKHRGRNRFEQAA